MKSIDFSGSEFEKYFSGKLGDFIPEDKEKNISGRDSLKYLQGSNIQDLSKILGGSPKELSGAEKSMLFFLGMATNAGKAGSTFGGSATAGATALGTGMLKRSAAVKKYEREAPLKKLQLSNMIEKKDSDRRKDRTSFRKEYEALQEVKDMKDQVFAYSRLREAAAIDPNNPLARGVGDLALVFNFMKLLDPGSVVRESEFRAAASAGALGEQFKNLFDKPLSGALFTPEVRADFVERAENFLKGRGEIYDDIHSQRKNIALGEGFYQEELPILTPYTNWSGVVEKYGSFREKQKDNQKLVAAAAKLRKENLTSEEQNIFNDSPYQKNISNHPRKADIEEFLRMKGEDTNQDLNWEGLSIKQKIGILKEFEGAQ